MICVQNGPLNCKNSSPECTKNRYFETKNGEKKFSGEGAIPLPRPFHQWGGGHHLPTLHSPRRLNCRAYGAPTSAPSVAPAALDHSVSPRVWKSGYGCKWAGPQAPHQLNPALTPFGNLAERAKKKEINACKIYSSSGKFAELCKIMSLKCT